jgi:hypothetical protein
MEGLHAQGMDTSNPKRIQCRRDGNNALFIGPRRATPSTQAT